MASTGTPATKLLDKHQVPYTAHPYDHDPRAESFGLEAAEALGVEPARVFKTLVTDIDAALVVGVVPVDAHLDLKALAAAVGKKKAKMADVAAAERSSGYVAGGISPLGQRKQLPTVIDASAGRYDTVFCSGGRRGLDIELTPDDLVRLTRATLAPIAAH